MARFLLWAINHGSHQRGDPIAVHDDDHEFTVNEDPTKWLLVHPDLSGFPSHRMIVDVPGLPLDRARRALSNLKRAATVIEPERLAPDPGDRMIDLRRPRFTFKVEDPSDTEPRRIAHRLTLTAARKVSLSRGDADVMFEDLAGLDSLDTDPRDFKDPQPPAEVRKA